jgi:hypothetical protein
LWPKSRQKDFCQAQPAGDDKIVAVLSFSPVLEFINHSRRARFVVFQASNMMGCMTKIKYNKEAEN